MLGRAARQAAGAPLAQVETGGLGSLGDEPDLSLPGGPETGGQRDNLSGGARRRARSEQTPQTAHPSQAKGEEGARQPDPQTPQTAHPSQAEGEGY